ncbi:hypothetical protein TWF730_006276 [Orbilia blumenaviensis]|uniref:CFEM domain-containing protein n=1 Tax=Orbilia blumenaviensis TaxID=1796055 RepID=A0AAV9VGB8_9PEZI
MRFVSRLNLCLFLLRVVSARSIILARAEPPACIAACLPGAVGASGCPEDNAPCICASQTFYESLLPCVLINCGYADVSGLLTYGVEFCQRAGVNSAQRLSAFGKSAGVGSEGDDASVSTSVAPVEPTPAPEPEKIPSADPIPTIAPSEPNTITEAPATVEHTPTMEPTAKTGTKDPVVPSTFVVVSTTTSLESVAETTALSVGTSISSTPIEPSESSGTSDIVLHTLTTRSRTQSGVFTVVTSSKVDGSDTELVFIQTTDPTPRNTQPIVTTAPDSTSALPVPTADAPSSASTNAQHMFSPLNINSSILCLVALFFVLG